jgi:hypothetical protein
MHLDVRAFGPPPLKRMTEDLMRAYKTTVDFWAEDFKMKPLVDGITDETWRAAAAKYYAGEIIVGNDLLVV